MALGSPNSQGMGSMSGMTLQEQLAKLYAMSQALRQQSGFGAQPGQQGMATPPPMPQQPQQGGQMSMMGGQMPQMPMPQGQQGGGMGNMMQMLPMLMMMMGQKQPGLGQQGFGNQGMRAGF